MLELCAGVVAGASRQCSYCECKSSKDTEATAVLESVVELNEEGMSATNSLQGVLFSHHVLLLLFTYNLILFDDLDCIGVVTSSSESVYIAR